MYSPLDAAIMAVKVTNETKRTFSSELMYGSIFLLIKCVNM